MIANGAAISSNTSMRNHFIYFTQFLILAFPSASAFLVTASWKRLTCRLEAVVSEVSSSPLSSSDRTGDDLPTDQDHAKSQERRDILSRSMFLFLTGGQAMPACALEEFGRPALLGPLEQLIGSWEGNQGLNVVALPSRRSEPNDTGRFELIVRPYREILTFSPIEDAVRNRGGSIDQYVGAITYEQNVFATDVVPEELIHVETGMFLYLENIVEYDETTKKRTGTDNPAPFAVARSASIPHGNTAMLFGNVRTIVGAPQISDMNATPPNPGPKAPKEYLNPYIKPLNVVNPNKYLQKALSSQSIIRTTHLSLDSSQNRGGSVSNIPFLVNHANTINFSSDFWIETLQDGNQQLQYSQTMDIEFHKAVGGTNDDLIRWPHVTVNTLTKQTSSKETKEATMAKESAPRDVNLY